MAATATARTASARRATAAARARAVTRPARRAPAPARRTPRPARRPASPRRRRGNTPIGGFVPVAVGAVGGLADSGLVVRLTRSRLWIGLLAAMLVGIVALNVIALQFSASSSQAARQADELRQANSALRGDIATLQSNDKIAAAAAKLGLATPKPGDYRYLRPQRGDAAEAARRLRAGELSPAVAAPVATETAPVVADPVATESTVVADPEATAAEPTATAETEAPATQTAAPTVTDPATAAPAASGGGVTP